MVYSTLNLSIFFFLGLDDEEDFSCPPALETIEVQQQQVIVIFLKSLQTIFFIYL